MLGQEIKELDLLVLLKDEAAQYKIPTLRLSIKNKSGIESENTALFRKNLNLYFSILQLQSEPDHNGNERLLYTVEPSGEMKLYIRHSEDIDKISAVLPNRNIYYHPMDVDGAAGPYIYLNKHDFISTAKSVLVDLKSKYEPVGEPEDKNKVLDIKFNQLSSDRPIMNRAIQAPQGTFPIVMTFSAPYHNLQDTVKVNVKSQEPQGFFADSARTHILERDIKQRITRTRNLLTGNEVYTKEHEDPNKNSYLFVGSVSRNYFEIATDSTYQLIKFLKLPLFKDVQFVVAGDKVNLAELAVKCEENRRDGSKEGIQPDTVQNMLETNQLNITQKKI